MIISELNLVSLFYKLNEVIAEENDILKAFESVYLQSVEEW